jgi:hypothetical protein
MRYNDLLKFFARILWKKFYRPPLTVARLKTNQGWHFVAAGRRDILISEGSRTEILYLAVNPKPQTSRSALRQTDLMLHHHLPRNNFIQTVFINHLN